LFNKLPFDNEKKYEKEEFDEELSKLIEEKVEATNYNLFKSFSDL